MEFEPQGKTIHRFISFLKAEGKAKGTIEAYERIIKRLRRFHKKPFKALTRGDLEAFLAAWSEDKERNSPAYLNFVRTALKFFFKWLDGGEEYPQCVKWIKVKRVQRELDPRDILTEEEVLQLIKAADHPRDRALIHVLYESGGRISEIRNLRVRDVTFERVGVKKTLTAKLMIASGLTKGKERGKYLRLVDSAQILQEWLEVHPDPKADQPLWVSLHSKVETMLHQSTIRRMLKRVARRVKITKPVHPHAFRHAQVTASAKYLADQELKKKFGWAAGSQMLRVYSHITDRAVEEKELEMRGVTSVQDQSKRYLTHVKCSQCGRMYSAGKRICECGRPLDPDLGARYDKSKQELETAQFEFIELFQKLGPDGLREINTLLRVLIAQK